MTSPVFVDLYAGDFNGKPNITALVAAGRPWCGLGMKISEGTYYPRDKQADWINKYWAQIPVAAGARFGVDFFRWGYHYFRVDEDPIEQGEKYLTTVEKAGGFKHGDMLPMIDVETSENPPHGPAQRVIDGVTEFAEFMLKNLGCRPLLYAGSYLRDLDITDHMGCAFLSTAAYGSTLPARLYNEIGWSIDQLESWQYQGTESYSGPAGYPRLCPIGSGPADLSALTICNGKTPDEQLAFVRANMLIPGLDIDLPVASQPLPIVHIK